MEIIESKHERMTFPATLVHLQLGQAIDSFLLSRSYATTGADGAENPRQWRFAIACVLHAYAALEGVTNKLKFELFENEQSHHFTARDPLDMPLERFLGEWKSRVKIEDKLIFLGKQKMRELRQGVVEDMKEVRELRNLVAHGYVAKGDAVFEVSPDGYSALVADETRHKTFPRLKFSHPDNLTYE